MMAGNPNWWSMNGGGGGGGMHSPPHPQQHPLSSTYLSPSSSSTHNSQYHLYSSSTSSSSPALDIDHPSQDFPRSWSQLLTGGSQNDQLLERFGNSQCQYNWFMQNGEDNQHVLNRSTTHDEEQVAAAQNRQQLYGHVIAGGANEEYQLAASRGLLISRSSHQLVSSPTSCVTTLSSNLLNFSTTKTDPTRNQQLSDHSTEGHSPISGGGVAKKPRLQQSSTQPALKVRKEKLGDRITALHQLVSPFGKTDTASVLSEAIGYIRFLLGQIEALSSPYLGNVSKSMGHQHSVQEMNCLFTQEPDQDGQSHDVMDLTSRGLCLVPISCTQHVGNDNGADYWAPAFGGGF